MKLIALISMTLTMLMITLIALMLMLMLMAVMVVITSWWHGMLILVEKHKRRVWCHSTLPGTIDPIDRSGFDATSVAFMFRSDQGRKLCGDFRISRTSNELHKCDDWSDDGIEGDSSGNPGNCIVSYGDISFQRKLSREETCRHFIV